MKCLNNYIFLFPILDVDSTKYLSMTEHMIDMAQGLKDDYAAQKAELEKDNKDNLCFCGNWDCCSTKQVKLNLEMYRLESQWKLHLFLKMLEEVRFLRNQNLL